MPFRFPLPRFPIAPDFLRASALIMPLALALMVIAPASGADVTVAKFRLNVPGAFCFTFDDALPTQLIYAAPYLDQVGLKGSFYLITNNVVDGAAGSPAIGKATTWADWKVVADSGHEIGSHTLTHRDLTTLTADVVAKELTESGAKIKEKLGITPVTLAYPYNARNAAVTKAMLQTYIAARESQVGYGSEPGMANTVAAMNKFLDDAIAGKKVQIGMIHGLTEPYSPTDPAMFLEHLKYCRKLVDDKRLWVPTFGTYSRYRIEKDSVRIVNLPSTLPHTIEFRAESPLDSAVFNVPLTFLYKIPDLPADSVKVMRANAPVPFQFNGELVLIEALPGPAAITISWNASSDGIRAILPGTGRKDGKAPGDLRLINGQREPMKKGLPTGPLFGTQPAQSQIRIP